MGYDDKSGRVGRVDFKICRLNWQAQWAFIDEIYRVGPTLFGL